MTEKRAANFPVAGVATAMPTGHRMPGVTSATRLHSYVAFKFTVRRQFTKLSARFCATCLICPLPLSLLHHPADAHDRPPLAASTTCLLQLPYLPNDSQSPEESTLHLALEVMWG